MSLEQAFLDRIAVEPENALHRQIYADWLEEQGDPRGELLRIQEQLRTLNVPDRPRVEQRMHELLDQGVQPLTIVRQNSIGMHLVLLFPGRFLMGSPPQEQAHSSAENQVEVQLTRRFWLGQYPVTQAEYYEVVRDNPGYFTQEDLKTAAGRRPVVRVNWDDATAFCRKLTERERAENCLPAGWEYTLPTEAQWEYGCRAGTTTATAFGNNLSSTRANFDGNQPYGGASQGPYKQQTSPAGSYPPNAWNLYDLHGNVWEWCRDGYRNQLPGGIDPEVVATGWDRVVRGGCWDYPGRFCRSAMRLGYTADNRYLSNLGFRVVQVQAE